MTNLEKHLLVISTESVQNQSMIGYVHSNFILIYIIKKCDMYVYIGLYFPYALLWCVYTAVTCLRHFINVAWPSLRDISYINIINLLLHNYYWNSNLIYTAYIIYKYDLFILYRTAAIYSHTDQNARDMRHLYGDLAGANRIVNKPYIVFNSELGLI